MSHKAYLSVTLTIFAFIALLHLLRIVFDLEVAIGGWSIPMWMSWVAFVIAAILAYSGFKLKKGGVV